MIREPKEKKKNEEQKISTYWCMILHSSFLWGHKHCVSHFAVTLHLVNYSAEEREAFAHWRFTSKRVLIKCSSFLPWAVTPSVHETQAQINVVKHCGTRCLMDIHSKASMNWCFTVISLMPGVKTCSAGRRCCRCHGYAFIMRLCPSSQHVLFLRVTMFKRSERQKNNLKDLESLGTPVKQYCTVLWCCKHTL